MPWLGLALGAGVGLMSSKHYEQKVMLCLQMLMYSAFADETQGKTVDEVKNQLLFFFAEDVIRSAQNKLKTLGLNP